jgi:hypothetical protein
LDDACMIEKNPPVVSFQVWLYHYGDWGVKRFGVNDLTNSWDLYKLKKGSTRSKSLWSKSNNLSSPWMRKNGVKVVKEADHVDVIGEVAEDQEEGMVLTFLINKREVKIHKPQESVEEEVSQDHIEECMTKLMLNVILVKYLGIML